MLRNLFSVALVNSQLCITQTNLNYLSQLVQKSILPLEYVWLIVHQKQKCFLTPAGGSWSPKAWHLIIVSILMKSYNYSESVEDISQPFFLMERDE